MLDVFLKVNVEVGPNVKIGAYTHIKDSVISDNTIIKPYSHIDSAKVGINNIIGPYARLRPGTETNKDVHIGNYVEIKNSKIGSGTKINHLSYIGDSIVGSNVMLVQEPLHVIMMVLINIKLLLKTMFLLVQIHNS